MTHVHILGRTFQTVGTASTKALRQSGLRVYMGQLGGWSGVVWGRKMRSERAFGTWDLGWVEWEDRVGAVRAEK